MAVKRRFVGPGGAVFVPNVPEDTIEQMVRDGLWKPFEEPKPEPEKRSYKRKQ
jgi:hypothetical protein